MGGLKKPRFPAFLYLLTWDALPPNKCSSQLKNFVEGQNLPRSLMDKFNWQYKSCHIPMISAAFLRQDKVLGRGGHTGGGPISRRWTYLWKILSLIFISPNDMHCFPRRWTRRRNRLQLTHKLISDDLRLSCSK